MNERKEAFNREEKTGPAIVIEERDKRANNYAIVVVITAIALVIIIGLVYFLVNSHNKEKELAAALAEATDSLERQMQLTADLEAYSVKQASESESLKEQLEGLLNIQEPDPVITSAQLEEQLVAIRELVTQKYIYTNADRGEYNKTWLWGWDMPFSDKSLLIKYDGTIKAGIDLNEVKINVDEDSRTITVTLPASKITDHNVSQDSIQTYETKDGLFNKVTPDDSNELITKGKVEMEAKAIERGLLADADAEAKATIKAFLSLLPGIDTYTLIIQ